MRSLQQRGQEHPQKLHLRFLKTREAKAKVEVKHKPRNTESPVVDL